MNITKAIIDNVPERLKEIDREEQVVEERLRSLRAERDRLEALLAIAQTQ